MSRVHRLANGVTVVCDAADGFETLALSVVAGRGARFEDAPRSGWSHLLEHMVFKGAGARSARDIVEEIEAAGGSINAATGQERTSFQVRALKGGLPLAIEVTADLVLRPTLDAGDLVKEVQVVGQEIAEAADTPDDQVFELAQGAAFADQPLGRPILGKPETIATADPATLEAWRSAIYAPDRLVVSCAGAVDEDELLTLAEAAFGTSPAPSAPNDAPAATFTGGQATETRKLEQAHLVFMLPAPGVTDVDHWALRLCPRVFSRKPARSSVWPTPSTPGPKPGPRPACSGSTPAARRPMLDAWRMSPAVKCARWRKDQRRRNSPEPRRSSRPASSWAVSLSPPGPSRRPPRCWSSIGC